MSVYSSDFPLKTRANATARLPYGYFPSESDPLTLVPDEEMKPFIVEALDAIDKRTPLREVAAWLSEKTGKKISHQGINKIWKERRGSDKANAREKELKRRRKRNAPKTSEEKAKAKVKRKLADNRRLATINQKRLSNWDKDEEPEEVSANSVEPYPTDWHSGDIPADWRKKTGNAKPKGWMDEDDRIINVTEGLDLDAAPEDQDVIFKPNPGPQMEFLASGEKEVLYGGAAGGGKTYALIADPLRFFHHPQFNGLILRRTNDELREIVWKTQELYPRAFPGAKWSERKSAWTFPSGARLWLTYLERPEDVLRYQGQAFSYIAFDELTQHPTPYAWTYMRSRLRTTAADLPTYMRATTNPGGPGHGWVKRMFIDPAPANTSFVATNLDTGEPMVHPDKFEGNHPKAGQANPDAGKPLFRRRFIPASLYDNPYLMEGGEYEAGLLSLPENQRRQLLEGDWAIAEGAAFPEFRPHIHTMDPFEIPANWRRFRSCDYGYSSYSAVHWFAIDPAYETLVCYRELYVSKHTGRDLAKAVLEAERGEQIAYGVLDSSCWHQRGQVGPSIAEEMISVGCRWRPSDRTAGARVNGKNRMHELLKVDPETEKPGIVFFNTCRQIIADLPVIPSDPKGTDDIDPRYTSDHAYDSVRYAAMSRPRAVSPFADQWGHTPTQQYNPVDSTFGY